MKLTPLTARDITVRTFRPDDLNRFVELANDPAIGRNMGWMPYPYTRAHGRKFIRRAIQVYRKRRPLFIRLAIEYRGELVGGIGISRIEANHQASVGYWLGAAYRGRGIMTRVLKLAVRFAFTGLGLRRVYAYTYLHNHASETVLERNGFVHEGTLRKFLPRGGRFVSAKLWAKVK